MAITVRVGIRIRAPPEFVFQHLLTAHHMARWFCNFAQFDPKGPAVGSRFRIGGDYAIVPADPPGWTCEILSGEILKAVTFRWPLPNGDTRVHWRVEPAPEGSVFRVVHDGLPGEECPTGTYRDGWRICLGNLKAVTEARDDSLRPDASPAPGGRVRLDLLVGAPPEKVFAALTEPEELRRWTEPKGDPVVEARTGGRYSFGWPAEGAVSAIRRPVTLAVEWPIRGAETVARFTLEEKSGERTGLYFVHEGVPAADPREPVRIRARWSDLLVGLKSLLEAGEVGFTEPYESQLEGA